MTSDEDCEAGMMLPEVLVGLAILSLATIAMLRVFSGATLGVQQVEAMRAHMTVAENLLSRLVASGGPPPSMQDGEQAGLVWAIRSQPIGATAGGRGWNAYRVRISVGDASPLIESIVLGAGRRAGH